MPRFTGLTTRLRVLGGTTAALAFAVGGQLTAPAAAHAETMAGDMVAGTTYYTQVCPTAATQTLDTCVDVISIAITPEVPPIPTIPCPKCPPPPPQAPSDAHWYNVDIGLDHYSGSGSTHDYHVEQKSSDWWNATSAGNNWVDGSRCVGYGPWWCNAKSWGSFWDQQKGASTDWSDWDLRENFSGYSQQVNEYGRFWLYPGGHYEVYVGR